MGDVKIPHSRMTKTCWETLGIRKSPEYHETAQNKTFDSIKLLDLGRLRYTEEQEIVTFISFYELSSHWLY